MHQQSTRAGLLLRCLAHPAPHPRPGHVLALCLWGVCAVDYATPGHLRSRRQHQIPGFPAVLISGATDRAGPRQPNSTTTVLAEGIRAIVRPNTQRLPAVFLRTASALRSSRSASILFPHQAEIWVVLSLLMYFGCVYLLWRTCPALRPPGTGRHLRRRLPSAVSLFRARPALGAGAGCASLPHIWHFARTAIGSPASPSASSFSSHSFWSRSRWCSSGSGVEDSRRPRSLRRARNWHSTSLYFGPAVMRAYFARCCSTAHPSRADRTQPFSHPDALAAHVLVAADSLAPRRVGASTF